eukprot:1457163-Amphidinium_carterae.1
MAYLEQSVATTEGEVEPLLQLLDPAEVDADPTYSPVVTPEPQQVDSSSESSSNDSLFIPNFLEMT